MGASAAPELKGEFYVNKCESLISEPGLVASILIRKLSVSQSRVRCTDSAYVYVLKLPIADDHRRHPPVPRESKKWHRLYRLLGAVERVNSWIEGLLGVGKVTVRGMAKVAVRSLLSLLVMLAVGVGMAQRHRLKDLRALVT